MDMMQIVGLGFVTATLAAVLRQQRPEMAMQLSLALAAIIFFWVLGKIGAVLTLFRELAEKAGIDMLYLNTLLKIIGVAYVAEFGAQVCRDAGESVAAGKIELAGKVTIMVMAIPIIALVLNTMVKFLP